ncbi:hypothetical protein PIB30_028320 [Stylosanthes scabra]|uniref:Uncharacterized protein n=1 Tax=Stylosanthes scabra TaxID=79078 RepID=A0ABU6ZA22_9FABA|nr:hypothetical protein [Stylosanthes scabra]
MGGYIQNPTSPRPSRVGAGRVPVGTGWVATPMAGGLCTLLALRRRLIAKHQSDGEKDGNYLATADFMEETLPSLAKKRKRAQKEVTEESSTLVNALENGFDPILFVDRYLMTSEVEEALEDTEAEDSIVHVQHMLLRATVYCRDVQRKNAGIPALQTLLSKKDKSIKTLSYQVTDLEAESKSQGAEALRLEGVKKTLNEKFKKLEEEKRAAEKRVTELEASLKKAREVLVSMEKMKEEVEESVMTGVANIEKNMLEQVSLFALGTCFSKVLVYTKVVDGQIVEVAPAELPEVPEILK